MGIIIPIIFMRPRPTQNSPVFIATSIMATSTLPKNIRYSLVNESCVTGQFVSHFSKENSDKLKNKDSHHKRKETLMQISTREKSCRIDIDMLQKITSRFLL